MMLRFIAALTPPNIVLKTFKCDSFFIYYLLLTLSFNEVKISGKPRSIYIDGTLLRLTYVRIYVKKVVRRLITIVAMFTN